MFSLTHQFIVKMYTYLQGYMFQFYRAIIRPVLKNRSISNFICTVGIPSVYNLKYYCIQCFGYVKITVGWWDERHSPEEGTVRPKHLITWKVIKISTKSSCAWKEHVVERHIQLTYVRTYVTLTCCYAFVCACCFCLRF
jgi:hypothetical protein